MTWPLRVAFQQAVAEQITPSFLEAEAEAEAVAGHTCSGVDEA